MGGGDQSSAFAQQEKCSGLKVLLCVCIWPMFCNSDEDRVVLHFLTTTTCFDFVGLNDSSAKLMFLEPNICPPIPTSICCSALEAGVEAELHRLRPPPPAPLLLPQEVVLPLFSFTVMFLSLLL